MYSSRYQRDPDDPPPYHPCTVEQWASKVLDYSSQYSNIKWSANQALGAPKVYPNHGDFSGAWASLYIDKYQYIELEYKIPVKPTALRIYETFNPGGVVAVTARDINGPWILLWKCDSPTRLTSSRIFSPPIAETEAKIDAIRLHIDCTAARTWCEIDAVQLVGIRDGAVTTADNSSLTEDFQTLVNNKRFSDVTLEIDDQKIHAHKAILGVRSPFFAKMFEKSKSHKFDVKLQDFSSTDLLAVMTYIYTNQLPRDCEIGQLVSLCRASPKLEMPKLRAAVVSRFAATLTCDNVLDAYHMVSKDDSLDDLTMLCLKYMADHLNDMSKVPAFEKLPQNIIVQIVQTATAKITIS